MTFSIAGLTLSGPSRPFMLSLTAALLMASACQPASPPAPDVQIADVWARPSRPMMGQSHMADSTAAPVSTSAVYLTLTNAGGIADTLIGANTDVANAVEIHKSLMEDGVMRMRQVQSVEIPAGGSAELKPGGLHIMLIGLRRDLAVGDQFGVILQLAQGGDRPVDVVVRQPE
ncbi:MAG: copper chaperone PCu(A)C [Rhodothermales bacterium]|nr:copper chaperone PCu(A)C [Rhodothermales bacterium]